VAQSPPLGRPPTSPSSMLRPADADRDSEKGNSAPTSAPPCCCRRRVPVLLQQRIERTTEHPNRCAQHPGNQESTPWLSRRRSADRPPARTPCCGPPTPIAIAKTGQMSDRVRDCWAGSIGRKGRLADQRNPIGCPRQYEGWWSATFIHDLKSIANCCLQLTLLLGLPSLGQPPFCPTRS
jgi:hypothetical protein